MQRDASAHTEPAQHRNKTQERLQKKLKQRKAQVKVTKDDQ